MNATEVRGLLVRAVEEKGAEYRYPDSEKEGTMCRYFTQEDGRPSCIVGHALAYNGFEPDENYEGAGAIQVAWFLTNDERVSEALQAAQTVQDEGGTWGEALAAYDASLAGAQVIDRGAGHPCSPCGADAVVTQDRDGTPYTFCNHCGAEPVVASWGGHVTEAGDGSWTHSEPPETQ